MVITVITRRLAERTAIVTARFCRREGSTRNPQWVDLLAGWAGGYSSVRRSLGSARLPCRVQQTSGLK